MNAKELKANINDVPMKKTYQKPVITKVQLLAEQAVLALCKTGAGVRDDCGLDLNCITPPRS